MAQACLPDRQAFLCGFGWGVSSRGILIERLANSEFSSGLGVGVRLHRQECLCHKNLRKPVGAAAEEFEEAEVAEDLELLADFGVDVAVLRVEAGEFVGVGINVG